ncbi:hypothetical protein Misp01_08590 [Microtetraspora sp. NBRC 13810]|nr:hypothetical protein Misp01_08590 [Microtetraspora sp. NBRC 13810]
MTRLAAPPYRTEISYLPLGVVTIIRASRRHPAGPRPGRGGDDGAAAQPAAGGVRAGPGRAGARVRRRGPRVRYGGFAHSGMGREMGVEGVREFMDTHSVGFPA